MAADACCNRQVKLPAHRRA